jgi:predicted transcriptional regulator
MNNFVFYGDWYANIKALPVEVQDKIIADIVRYGIDEELAHNDDITVSMAVNFTKRAIDESKAKYQLKVENGKINGRSKKINDNDIYELARAGKKSAEIAVELGISKSAVDHSEGWKNRKNDNFSF